MSASKDSIQEQVSACLKKVDEMKEKNEDLEKIADEITTTLNAVCPVDETILEAAPLQYKLACILIDIVHKRSDDENADEELDGVNEDDMQIAWENLESARILYKNAEDGKDYRKEIADIYMSLGDLDMEKGDFEAAVNDTKEALKIRSQIFPEVSRKIADCYFFLGISYFYMAQNNALLSEDDKSLEKVAEENAKESKTNLEKSRSIFGKLCVEKAVEMKVLEAKEEDWEKGLELIKAKKEIPTEVKELLDNAEDMKETIDNATKFSVANVIAEEKKNVDALRELMKSDKVEDDEDDEDFEEEEEEEEDDDIVIENVEDVRGMKRGGESLKDTQKRMK